MTFQFSREGLTRRARIVERAFEMLPGAASWTILLGMLLLAFCEPIPAAVLIIAFDLYWLLRLFYMTIFLVLSSCKLWAEQETDWMAKARTIDHAASPRAEQITHVIVIPVLKEAREILEPGIESLARQTFPAKQLLVMLALEERADASVKADVQAIAQRHRDRFFELLTVTHPDGLPGEARVKGANVTYAAKVAASRLSEHGIPLEHAVVSCFDADTVVSPQYFACLTYTFLTCPERTRASFQPIPVYHNNLWEVPAFARVLDIGASFFQLIEATNPEKLVTFSSHSMSFKALVDVGYWPVDMISDDSAIYWKAFIHYDGRYRVVPLYVTVSMDVAAADSWWKAAVAVYKQKRRWAWGVENFPIVMRAFLTSRTIPLSMKLQHGFKLFEGHIAWATSAFLVAVIGWIPALFAGREFSSSVLYYSAPRITATIFHLSSLTLLTTIILSFCLLPRSPTEPPWWKRFGLALEWLLIPLITILLGAAPALEAQTRLMLGRYMEFWVTEKKRPLSPSRKARMMEPHT